MSALRLVGNLLLALILVLLSILILFTGFGYLVSRSWEDNGLDDGNAEGAWMWIGGQPIHYRSVGNEQGSALVLVHGLAIEGSDTWVSNTPSWASAGLRVISVDLRGMGHSVRDTSPSSGYSVRGQAILLAKALNQLRVRRATVVGQGWGSAVALQLASEQPQFVGRLALISPLVYEAASPLCPAVRQRLWGPVAAIPYLRDALLWSSAGGGPLWGLPRSLGSYDARVWRSVSKQMRATGHIDGSLKALVAMSLSAPDSDLPSAIPTLDVPALVIVGREDRWPSRADGERLAKELRDAVLVTIPEARHYVHLEQSVQVNQRIEAFALQGLR